MKDSTLHRWGMGNMLMHHNEELERKNAEIRLLEAHIKNVEFLLFNFRKAGVDGNVAHILHPKGLDRTPDGERIEMNAYDYCDNFRELLTEK